MATVLLSSPKGTLSLSRLASPGLPLLAYRFVPHRQSCLPEEAHSKQRIRGKGSERKLKPSHRFRVREWVEAYASPESPRLYFTRSECTVASAILGNISEETSY